MDFQGNKLSDPASVLACAKHFIGDGGTQDGVWIKAMMSAMRRTIRKLYLPPYQAAIKAGVGSIMVFLQQLERQKNARQQVSDHRRVERAELGFRPGFLVSDWVQAIKSQISPDYKADVENSINAGVDMVMIPNGPGQPNNFVEFIQDLKQLVAENKIPMTRIDDAVRRILRVKFEMGLFENPGTDPALTAEIGSAEHRAVARDCVRQSIVQLKNNNRTLPLAKNVKHLAVVGAAADDIGVQCGGWTISWQGQAGNTLHGGTTIPRGAIRNSVAPGTAGDLFARRQ